MNLIEKVSDFASWLPIPPNIVDSQPLPNLPHPVLASEEMLLAQCINHLVNPPNHETDSYWETPVGHDFALTMQFVCGQFIREFLDKNFSLWKMPRHWRKEVKQHFSCQAEVMGQIWRLVKLLPLDQNPRSLVFHAIVLDYALVFCHAWIKEEQDYTATAWLKKQQEINRKLQIGENPFDPKIEPETWRFIEQARREADRSNSFFKDYAKLIRARMAMIATFRKSRFKKFDQSGQAREMRGRKSISSSRSRSE